MEIVLPILILLAVLAFGINIGGWLKEKELNKKILSKKNIVACFKDVDWSVQHFYFGDTPMKSKDGTEVFYKVPSIDDAIAKLNNLMASSPANKACTGLASSVSADDGSARSASQ